MITEFIETAGITAFPLLLAAFLAVFIIIERTIVFLIKYRRINKEKYLKAAAELYFNKIKQSNIINEEKGITAGIYSSVLQRKPENRKEFKLFLDAEELEQLPKLERGLGLLNFIAQASPTLGLLGTVSGMIKTFQVLGIGGSPAQMAVGISEALFTTAAGLIIALPAAAFYHYFYSKIDKLTNQMDNLRLETETMLFDREIKERNNNEISV